MLCSFILGCGSNATGGGGGGGGGTTVTGTIDVCVTYDDTGTSEIIMLNAEGGYIKQLVSLSPPSTLEALIMPPTGNIIVYEYKKNGLTDNWGYASTEGDIKRNWLSDARQVKYSADPATLDPTKTPPNYYVVYVSSDATASNGYSLYKDGTATVKCAANPLYCQYPDLSYGGNYIAYTMYTSKYEIHAIQTYGTTTYDCSTYITGDADYASFAPLSGTALAFMNDLGNNSRHIAATTNITASPKAQPWRDTHSFSEIYYPLIWSDDGNYLYFAALPVGNPTNVAIYRLDMISSSHPLVKLTNTTGGVWDGDLMKFAGINKLYFIRHNEDLVTDKVYSMNMNGSGQKELLATVSGKRYFFKAEGY